MILTQFLISYFQSQRFLFKYSDRFEPGVQLSIIMDQLTRAGHTDFELKLNICLVDIIIKQSNIIAVHQLSS